MNILVLIRIVSAETNWEPMFALHRMGHREWFVLNQDSRPRIWGHESDLFEWVRVNLPEERIVWEGTTF